jgi:ABC-type branched-subunit amino acid transport system substrate-binding protein
MNETDEEPDRGRSRRRVLAAAGSALGAGLAGCGGDGGAETEADDPDQIETDETTPEPTATTATTTVPAERGGDDFPPLGNYPVEGDSATYGFTVPVSGPFSALGEAERRGYELAVQHLNEGGGWADSWTDLSGDGVLGYTVEGVVRDTATDPAEARQAAAELIDRDEALLVSGGASTAAAFTIQEVCQQERVQYMAALTQSPVLTGEQCARYGFREMHTVSMGASALATTLTDELGEDGTFSVLYPDYAYGQSVQESVRRQFEGRGWTTGETVSTPLGTEDYTTFLESIPQNETDVLVLGQFGNRGAQVLRRATEMGLATDTTLAVPLMDRTFLETAGSAIDGVYGTADWHWTRDERFSNAFTERFRAAYDQPPSSAARLAYAATMRYSAAVERAGTFYPPEVIRELEGNSYANTGLGRALSRACDHQSIRSVYVLRGQEPDSGPAPVEIAETVDGSSVAYACSESPASECELGDYR